MKNKIILSIFATLNLVSLHGMETNDNSTSIVTDIQIPEQKKRDQEIKRFLDKCESNPIYKAQVFIDQYEQQVAICQQLKAQGHNTQETDAMGLNAETQLKRWQQVLMQECINSYNAQIQANAPTSIATSLSTVMEAAHEFADKTL